jgi:tetratricopeptide (TPR) repeat protein
MGEFDPDDKKFQKWQKLRSDLKEAKREKDPEKIIKVCQSVIELDAKAKYIQILVPLFEKDMAKAYQKLGKNEEALSHFKLALKGYQADRQRTGQVSSWEKDIASLEKAIAKLESDLAI